MGKRVIIAGGGAAGLTAAVFAARQGAEVTVLEGMERPGKKLLLTGNGRCNLTNLDVALSGKYYGSGAAVARKLTEQFGASEVLSFFEELGLLTTEKNGYVYPYSLQSGAVLGALLSEIRRLRVKLKLGEKVESIQQEEERWKVKTASWCYTADALVLACGGKAVPSTGSDGSGYALARMLGHSVTVPRPALVPLECNGRMYERLSGVRCRAAVSLYRAISEKNKNEVQKEAVLLKKDIGELQWTKYGVSGIVIFQLSRFVSTASHPQQMYLEVDLLPDFEKAYLVAFLERRAALFSKERTVALLSGLLHEKLIPVLLKNAEIPEKLSCGEVDAVQIERLVVQAKKLRLSLAGTKSFDVCQVCAGGVDCREVSDKTLQSKKWNNLFFAGELLDVDGPCGGYNLQWAWTSGYVAGMSAGKEKKEEKGTI